MPALVVSVLVMPVCLCLSGRVGAILASRRPWAAVTGRRVFRDLVHAPPYQ
jgi:hypothetical protein